MNELIHEESSDCHLDQRSYLRLNEIDRMAMNNEISLPTVQRGFVWKPYQIENLWDSLLRGYPVGAFVLSKKITSKSNEFELLDGQQRASAICLGFFDPSKNDDNANRKIFKTSYENIMVFIDLQKPDKENDNRKYLFRVITRSHPWGYRKLENQKILEAKDRNKAMNFYQLGKDDYLKKPLKEFWPYDSYEPIPLGLFMNATNVTDLKQSIEHWRNKVNYSSNKVKEIKKETASSYTVDEVFEAVKKMLAKQKMPLLFLDSSHVFAIENSHETDMSINEDQSNTSNDEPGIMNDENSPEVILGKIEDRNISEVENLFIRLNSGGTPLKGEELNYSILKAHISIELQRKIEENCKGLFYPARFITIVFRLYNNIPKKSKNVIAERDSINMKIKPRQFQRMMREEDKSSFIDFLEKFLSSNYIAEIKKILIYNANSHPIGLPSFIAYSIADKAPEIMFMLTYRLYIKRDEITDEILPLVLGLITLFVWLGKGEKQKDHGKLLENIWNCVKTYDTKTFWSSETLHRAMIKDMDYDIMTPFPDLKTLKGIIPKESFNIQSMTFDKVWGSSKYGNFIDKIFYNKELILYAQRAKLFECYKTCNDFLLEDTNRPFDYDHICPNSFIHNKRSIHRALRDWYSSNGNYRVWPFSQNRGDQDDAPAVKFKTPHDLKDSFCKEDWLELGDEIKKSIRDTSTAKRIINCILNRNIDLCMEWYTNFNISKLVPESPKRKNILDLFEGTIKKYCWKGVKENEDRYAYYSTIKGKACLYFSFNTEEFNTLKNNNVYFGIYEEEPDLMLPKIKTTKEQNENVYIEKQYYYSKFTLISYSENSLNLLFKEFYVWLLNLRFDSKQMAIDRFNKSIRKEWLNIVLSSVSVSR